MGFTEIVSHKQPDHLLPDMATWNKIWEKKPVLTPDYLTEFFPKYEKFLQVPNHPLLWSKTGTISSVETPMILNFFAATATGKDTLLEKINKPWLRIVTTTSRPNNRPDEIEGQTYHFVSQQQFDQMVQDNQFLEYMTQVSGSYGTTKDELRDKKDLAQLYGYNILIWRGNLEGSKTFSPAVEKELGIRPVSVFILPRMQTQEYKKHIERTRGLEEARKRWPTAQAEIQHAPEMVDYVLINPFDGDVESGKAQAAAALNYLLSQLCASC